MPPANRRAEAPTRRPHPESCLIPGVRGPDDQKDEQMVNSRPDKQADRRDYRDEDDGADQAAERTADPVARGQGDQKPRIPLSKALMTAQMIAKIKGFMKSPSGGCS